MANNDCNECSLTSACSCLKQDDYFCISYLFVETFECEKNFVEKKKRNINTKRCIAFYLTGIK